ncbi:MAG: hypothetical protein ABJA34_02615 [Pseudonocardiales bacterium]
MSWLDSCAGQAEFCCATGCRTAAGTRLDRWIGEPANQDVAEHDGLAWVDRAQAAALHLADPRLLGLIALVLRAQG